MQFTHNGTIIELTSLGRFRATINGKTVIKPSLQSMKDLIDKSEKSKFEPFDAFEMNGRRIVKFKVLDIVKSGRRRFGSQYKFKTSDDGAYQTSWRFKALLDTTENRAALRKLEAFKKKRQQADNLMAIEEARLAKLVIRKCADAVFNELMEKSKIVNK